MTDDTISRQAMINEIDLHVGILYDSPTLVASLKQMVEELPPAQPVNIAKLQPNCNQVASDCISRQAVIDAVDDVDWYHQNKNGEMVHGANSDEHQAWYKADDIYTAIESVPSAQLAQDLTNGCTDTISRAAVGDALNRIEISRNASWYEFYQKALTAVGTLPSAQPDVSDTNQSRGEVTVYANR